MILFFFKYFAAALIVNAAYLYWCYGSFDPAEILFSAALQAAIITGGYILIQRYKRLKDSKCLDPNG